VSFLDTLSIALQTVSHNKLRSFLTALGIIIGVASVVAMVQLGQSATRAVTDQIASIGSNLLFVSPGTTRRGPGGTTTPAKSFDMADVQAIRNEISGIRVAPAATRTVMVVYGNANQTVSVTGTSNDYFDVRAHQLDYGRRFEPGELTSGAAVCIVGKTLVEEIYLGQNPLGTMLRVHRTACRVIGVLEEKGTSMGQDPDKAVLMPIKAAQRRLVGSLDVHTIFVSALVDGTTERIKDELESLLRQRRHIRVGEEDDFDVFDTQDVVQALEQTTGILTVFLGAIAAVSLLVGGIGIMNIMLVSVTERTREIGIRLAIGARMSDVLTQFLVEAVALSTIGGIVGLVLGVGGTWAATAQLKMPFVTSPGIMLLGFSFSVIIGIVFGLIPARKAAGLNPIDALRAE
jgi:putative ABC transport system permease protein